MVRSPELAVTGWQFTPDPGADSYVADVEYLHYGFWLKKTTDADGATTYNEVETFADGDGNPKRPAIAFFPMSLGSATTKVARLVCM